MRLRIVFVSLFCTMPVWVHADPTSELQARSSVVSRSVGKSVAVEQAKNQERIKIQLRIDQLRNEVWKPNGTAEERKSVQRELERLQAQLNKL